MGKSIVVFDIANEAFSFNTIPFSALIFPFILMFILVIILVRKKEFKLSIFLLVIYFIWAFICLIGSFFDYDDFIHLKEQVSNKDYHVVEGCVVGNTVVSGRITIQKFYIRGVLFEFSDNSYTGGAYHKTIRNGGVLKEGVYAKIYYVHGVGSNLIVKLILYPDRFGKCEQRAGEYSL